MILISCKKKLCNASKCHVKKCPVKEFSKDVNTMNVRFFGAFKIMDEIRVLELEAENLLPFDPKRDEINNQLTQMYNNYFDMKCNVEDYIETMFECIIQDDYYKRVGF